MRTAKPSPRASGIRPRGHIAWIVGGALAVGLVGGVGLVLVVFAGANEHVITGSALVSFAVGWMMLAVLTARWTDQPQRWAFVPATCMGLVGVGLLTLAPDNAALEAAGWVWPPSLVALVAWMTAQARRQLRSRARPVLLYPVLAFLAVVALGGGYETVQEWVDRGTYAMPGQLFDVGGHRLHLYCTGSGSPPVVLEAGLGATSSMWGWIAPAVARDQRVCVYDRAGRG